MRKFLRKWLGITDLELQLRETQERTTVQIADLWQDVDALSNVTKALALPVPKAEALDEELIEDALPAEVEAMVGRVWFDQPQAAQITRTYARSLISKGMHPEALARRIAENGTVIE